MLWKASFTYLFASSFTYLFILSIYYYWMSLFYWENYVFVSFLLTNVFLLWVSIFSFIIWNSFGAGNFLLLCKIFVILPTYLESFISEFFTGDSECYPNKRNLPWTLSNLGSDFYILMYSYLFVVLTDVLRLVEVLSEPTRLL